MDIKYTITFLAAIFGAILGQLLSHLFTQLREKKKLEKDVYLNLVAPFLNDVIYYINTESHPRVGHDVDQRIKIKEVINNINQNIKYGNSELFLAMFNYQESKIFYDASGHHKQRGELEFIYWYLDFVLHEGIKGMGYESENVLKLKSVIRTTQTKCGFWYLMCNQIGFDGSRDAISCLYGCLSDPFADYTIDEISKFIKNGEEVSEFSILFEDGYKNIKVKDISYKLFEN
ncbi:hypothetical protein ABE044_12870 [Bacillus altitudinis]|uniref:hypothetical protein n=1 Tax=Bacillus altitudinis TaxID=293387 RepID=UPI003D244610